jgi:D-tagatose-1,6-bisphosphate aldolase subunit GatZ/KbaZ
LNGVPQKRDCNATASLRASLLHNRASGKGGVYAVCSAHPWVIDAAIEQAKKNGAVLHVESTSSQVNQLGGYTRQTPAQFADFISSAARRSGFPSDRILLGGDHLGPFPWKSEPSHLAMQKACALVRACMRAGYTKIHLDASMACADDPEILPEDVVARRAALLCEAAEEALKELPPDSTLPLYVIGTEVPVPGGESVSAGAPVVTTVDNLSQTLKIFQHHFVERGLPAAWQRVIAVVVQPGVEFGDDAVFEYDRNKARLLSAALPDSPTLVYEAHSTDYQSPSALAQMVEDHFAILKVGPWLTFAFREAVFALSEIERELLSGKKGEVLSSVRDTLDQAMLRQPTYWRSYYHGDESQLRLARAYGYSDRCRYYWHDTAVRAEIERLLVNLRTHSMPLTLLSQYLPQEYRAIRTGQIEKEPGEIIRYHIQLVLRIYAAACGMKKSGMKREENL